MEFNLDKLKEITILYVEDEELIREQTANILKSLVHNVFQAGDGKEALKVFKKEKDIDIVISDINMPHMDGLKLCQELQKLDKNIPIVFTSAYKDEEYLLEALNLGVCKYLTKPLKIKDLMHAIIDSVENSQNEEKIMSTTKIIADDSIRTKREKNLLVDTLNQTQDELIQTKEMLNNFSLSCKISKDGKINEVSQYFCKTYKYEMQELLNKELSSFCKDYTSLQKELMKALKTDDYILTKETFLTKENEELTYNTHIKALYDDGVETYATGYILYQTL